jgi:glycosyltransferase involved in cell wall biosynthesis
MTVQRTVHILGTHGVPAAYGGFETAAENVGLHLAAKGWRVVVYCQLPGSGSTSTDEWKGIERVLIHEERDGWLGTASFDRRSIAYVLRHRQPGDVCLTFGYNTGVFNLAQRVLGIPNVINMDGMEWTRRRWGLAKQGILLGNERFAGAVGTVLIGDHPIITSYLQRHFGRKRVTTIAYGAYPMGGAPTEPVRRLGLTPGGYATMICRPIPENSVLEIVTAWSARRRGVPLVVLGTFDPADPYHARVLAAAGDEVRFPGAIYDPETVSALRFHGRVYLHGHTVGGTNPSLVEAMAAGNAVIAQDNGYNRFVAGEGNRYFTDATDLADTLDLLVDDGATLRRMGESSRERHAAQYTWEHIGDLYERALLRALGHERTSR